MNHSDDMRSIAAAVLLSRAGSSSGAEQAFVLRRVYDDLAGVLIPLIGDAGLRALTSRALHLAQREYPGAVSTEVSNDEKRDALDLWLEFEGPAATSGVASSVLSALLILLANLIGEPLTMRLLRKAWPDAFPESESKENHA